MFTAHTHRDIYDTVMLPHNLKVQVLPVDPFDQELPKDSKCFVFSHTMSNLKHQKVF